MLPIAVADYREVYDLNLVEAALAGEDGTGSGLLRKTYQRMQAHGSNRFLIKPATTTALDSLGDLCPNFQGVVRDLRKYLHLAVEGNESLSFMPLLLAGDPGVGKTHFAKRVTRALGLDLEYVSMGSMTAGWVLSGASPTWQGARHGKVAQKLIEGQTANPAFLLDELDKVGADSRYDPMGALLQLLEKETSTHFKDEFLDLPVDASMIFWIATANDLTRIPDAVLDRMAVYDVPAPTPAQAAVIGQLIYDTLLCEHKWKFEAVLTQSVLDVLSGVKQRDMKKRLLDGMGTALEAGRHVLTADDISKNSRYQRRSIGFNA